MHTLQNSLVRKLIICLLPHIERYYLIMLSSYTCFPAIHVTITALAINSVKQNLGALHFLSSLGKQKQGLAPLFTISIETTYSLARER
jgi:hypothetical protein